MLMKQWISPVLPILKPVLLTPLALFTVQTASASSFSELISNSKTAFSTESEPEQKTVLSEASEFASHFQQHRESDDGRGFRYTCRSAPESNRYCETYKRLRARRGTGDEIPKRHRTTFIRALKGLDDEATRANQCRQSGPALRNLANIPRLRARVLYWQWTCATRPQTKAELKERLWTEFPFSLQTQLVLEQDQDTRLQAAVQVV